MTEHPNKWWDKAMLRSYEQTEAYFKTCRNPAKGKPLRSWARIYKEEDGTFSIRATAYGNSEGQEIGKLTPDNVFTFTMTPHVARNTCAVTLAQSLYKALPFLWQRVGIAKYRVQYTSIVPFNQKGWVNWEYMRKSAPEYFQGMQFDLNTGVCINGKSDVITRINDAKRKEWLSALRKFKLTIKTMAKIGVFDTVVTQAISSKAYRNVPDWSSSDWLNLLYESIRDNTCSPQLSFGIASQGVQAYYWRKETNPYIITLSGLEYVCSTYSMDLRKMFGVFNEVSELPSKDEVSGNQMGQPEQTVVP